mmetsp:Transcript_11327/g.29934  ORF Transcript_11327/g.29934 Transcript_11327/m.29934 type:complete len:81 (-) Transcript_11327:265-507(-)
MKKFAAKAKAFAGKVKSKGSELMRPPCTIQFAFEGQDEKQEAPAYPLDEKKFPIFAREDEIKGAVRIQCNPGKRVERETA